MHFQKAPYSDLQNKIIMTLQNCEMLSQWILTNLHIYMLNNVVRIIKLHNYQNDTKSLLTDNELIRNLKI